MSRTAFVLAVLAIALLAAALGGLIGFVAGQATAPGCRAVAPVTVQSQVTPSYVSSDLIGWKCSR